MDKQIVISEMLESREKYWPECSNNTMHFVISLLRLGDIFIENADRIALEHNISFTEFEVLAALRSFGPNYELPPQKLCYSLLISSGGLTKVLYSLEKKNLITRSIHYKDKRSKPVILTESGKLLIEIIMNKVTEANIKVTNAVTQEETNLANEFLNLMLSKKNNNKKE